MQRQAQTLKIFSSLHPNDTIFVGSWRWWNSVNSSTLKPYKNSLSYRVVSCRVVSCRVVPYSVNRPLFVSLRTLVPFLLTFKSGEEWWCELWRQVRWEEDGWCAAWSATCLQHRPKSATETAKAVYFEVIRSVHCSDRCSRFAEATKCALPGLFTNVCYIYSTGISGKFNTNQMHKF
jgi:hypothetical protein